MFLQNKKILFFFILLLFCAHSCLDPKESNGKCTKCQPTQNLQNGYCYLKIRGCLTQKGFNCAQCQVGYILSQNQCIRQAQYFNLTTLMPPPQKIEESKISQSQITPVMVGGFKETANFNSPAYIQAKATLHKQYPALSGFRIYKVQQQLVNGINFIFYIMNVDNNDLYLAKVYVTFLLQASVEEIYKNNVSIKKGLIAASQLLAPVPGRWQQFMNISDSRYTESLALVKSSYSGLESYKLSRVEYQIVAGILFAFFYSSESKNNAFIVEVYKPFYGQATIQNTWGEKPSSLQLISSGSSLQPTPVAGGSQTLPNTEYNSEPFLTAKSAILTVFPTFDMSLVKSISQQVVAGYNVFVSFTLPGSQDIYDVTVFIPLAFTGQQPSLTSIKKNGSIFNPLSSENNITSPPSTNTQTVSPIVGGFTDTTDFNNNLFIQAKKTLFSQYPELQSYQLKKVQQQLVNGINYVFYLTDSKTGDKYIAKVDLNMQLQAIIDSLTKNNVDINNQSQNSQAPQSVNNQNSVTISPAGGFQVIPQSEYTSEPFSSVKSTILNTFPSFNQSLIKKVQRQLVAGWNYIVTFTIPNSSDLYQVTVYVPLAFTGDQPSITLIKKNNIEQDIQSFTMVQQDPSPTGFMTGGYSITTDFTSQFYLKAKSTLYSEYSFLQSMTVSKVEEQIVSGKNYLFTIVNNVDIYVARVYVTLSLQASVQEITKNNVSINKNQQSINTYPSTKTQIVPPASSNQQNQGPLQSSNTGASQDASPLEYNSNQFLPILQAIKKVIPSFDTKFIQKVSKQIVAGWVYFVTFSFSGSTDSYQLIVYQPLPYTGLEVSVQSAKKNGVSFDLSSFSKVGNQIYSWQNDTIFTQLYKFFRKQTNINNLLPFNQVNRQKRQNNFANWYEYKITFSKEQYAICRFYQDYQIFEVISYVIGGTEMYSSGSGRAGYEIYDRTENALVDKVKSNDAKKFGRIMVKEISVVKLSDFYRIYKLNGYTSEGHYELVFLDKGELSLIQTNKLDSGTCYSIDYTRQVQYRQEYIVDQIRTFLFAKYNLTGFEVTLAVGNVLNSVTNQYLILLVRSDLKKVRVLVEESNDKFVIRKIDVLNDGLAVISDNVFQKTIEGNARKDYLLDLNGFQRIVVTSNGTLNIAKFASDSAIITYTKSSSSSIKKQQFVKSNPCSVVKILTLDNCQKCTEADFLWKGKCYTKIPNCYVQVGSICAACDKFSIELNGKCVKDCSQVFSL